MVFNRRYLVFLLDILFIVTAYVLAYLLDFDFDLFRKPQYLTNILPILVVCKGGVFYFSRLYRSRWKYASLPDAFEIFKVVSLSSVVTLCAVLALRQYHSFSRVIFLLDWGILLSLVVSSRLSWRVYREMYIMPQKKNGPNTVIIGSGDVAYQLLSEIRKSPSANYKILGFLDDDPDRIGLRLGGLSVLGDTHMLSILAKERGVTNVIFANPAISKYGLRAIIRRCNMAGLHFKIMPTLSDLMSGKVQVSQIKDVDIDDLLGRETTRLDDKAVGVYLTGKRVVVSGAGGSIGSELCRQVALFAPKKIIMMDSAETPLFLIESELSASFPDLILVPVMVDVRNRERLECLFEEFMPEVVIHAAAYKHVPMMEYNPIEAVTNNIGGTRNLADLSVIFGVQDFVMVSTDKAVNPTNVMGATKRAAECYVQSVAALSTTKFTIVRFGNVLGSNGSVIPTFKEQIKNGGPITVTDPEVVRFFMTIPEASQLVLQAACVGRSGEIFVLDMGEPVVILELAEELIRLSGLEPYDDIDIVFSGLRPGEKLYEELISEGENIKDTSHEKIKVFEVSCLNFDGYAAELEQLFDHARNNDVTAVLDSLRLLVPEYTPAYHFNGEVPASFQRMRPDFASVNKDSCITMC